MKDAPDINDTLRQDGPDAVRRRHDTAKPYRRKGNGADAEPLPVAYSEDALASEFEARHGDELRYIAKRGQWRTWAGTHWRADETLNVYARARRICREGAERAKREFEDVKGAKLARILSAARTVAAVETMARALGPEGTILKCIVEFASRSSGKILWIDHAGHYGAMIF